MTLDANEKRLLLKFISGKYQGGEFPLPADGSIILGRSSDVEVVLVEDMVSRHHARISVGADGIHIEDMGSTNGCFVNGEKVKRAPISVGDRILVGTSIIKLIEGTSASGMQGSLSSMATGRQTAQHVKTMSGDVSQVPLPDLLQLLSASRKTAVLVVQTDRDVGRVYVRSGEIKFASVNDEEGVAPLKAVMRILSWQAGSFELKQEGADQVFADEMNMTTEALLMESMRQMDEWARVQGQLPPREARVQLVTPVPGKLSELKPVELDVLQLAINHGRIEHILDHSEREDSQTAEALATLLSRGILVQV